MEKDIVNLKKFVKTNLFANLETFKRKAFMYI